MSLINQVLQDLDARHAGEMRHSLHREVRPLPPENRRRRGLIIGLLATLVALVIALLLLAYAYRQEAQTAAASLLATAPAAADAGSPPNEAPNKAPNKAPDDAPNDAPAAAPESAPEQEENASADAATPAEDAEVTATSDAAEAAPSDISGDAADRDSAAAPPEAASAGGNQAAPASTPPPAPPPADAAAKKPRTEASRTAKAAPDAPPSRQRAAKPLAERLAAAKPGSDQTAPPLLSKTAPQGRSGQSDADYQSAVSLLRAARTGEAADLLLGILDRNDTHVAARQLLARLFLDLNRRDEALALLVTGLEKQPGQVQWAQNAARIFVDQGEIAAAAEILERSLPYASANAEYLGFAGYLAHRLERHAIAAERYGAACRLMPGDGRWWFGLGLALAADPATQHEAREAFTHARQSGNLPPDLAAIVEQKLR